MKPLELVNALACIALLLYLMPPAALAQRWRHRLPMMGAAIVLALQVVDPAIDWIPDVAWPTVLLNVTLLALVTAWRRPLWHLLQCRFDPAHPPRERCTDAAAYGDTLPMEARP